MSFDEFAALSPPHESQDSDLSDCNRAGSRQQTHTDPNLTPSKKAVKISLPIEGFSFIPKFTLAFLAHP